MDIEQKKWKPMGFGDMILPYRLEFEIPRFWEYYLFFERNHTNNILALLSTDVIEEMIGKYTFHSTYNDICSFMDHNNRVEEVRVLQIPEFLFRFGRVQEGNIFHEVPLSRRDCKVLEIVFNHGFLANRLSLQKLVEHYICK